MSEIEFYSENTLKSEKASLTAVEPILENLRARLGIKEEKFYNVMIAVTEAVNNAIIHGNKLNDDKSVFFIVSADNEKIHIKVKDEGEGFDPETIANCLEPENLLKSSGRGVFIIRELMDDLQIESSPNGTTIDMLYMYNNK
ncbi:MAG: ATP-binding protein [Candidatus Kapabacteria bacterium]|nr:ATP-binding protein [Ignavibacteriota bacterium]MCW5885509.1 ATP-binding protein [Candidatus Kapabacteria bacterium]